MDQLTCQTTSLNLCSNFGDHEFPEASSHVQINTLPSYKSKQTELVGPLVTTQKKQPWLLLELHFQITALTWTLDVFTFLLLLSLKARQEYSSLMRKTTYKRWLANSTEKLPKYIYISWNFFHRMRFCFPVTWQQVSSLPSSLLAIKKKPKHLQNYEQQEHYSQYEGWGHQSWLRMPVIRKQYFQLAVQWIWSRDIKIWH